MRIGIVFLLCSTGFLYSCSKIQEPEFIEVRGFRVKNLGLEEVTIGFGMTYYNPNGFSVSVKETGANVYLDSVYLGNFVQDTTVAVQEKSEFTIPLSGTIPLTTFFKLNMKGIDKRQVLIRADGSTKVGKAGLYTTKEITYKGWHRLGQLKL